MADLISLNDIKVYMGFAGTTVHDTLLSDLVTDISKWVESDTGRVFSKASYTEIFDIPNKHTDTIIPKQSPIIAVTSLDDNGSIIASGDLYIKDQVSVKLATDKAFFTEGKQKVTLKYDAGFAAIPEDLQLAIKMIISIVFEDIGSEAMKSEAIGRYKYTKQNLMSTGFFISMPSPQIEAILRRYRNVDV